MVICILNSYRPELIPLQLAHNARNDIKNGARKRLFRSCFISSPRRRHFSLLNPEPPFNFKFEFPRVTRVRVKIRPPQQKVISQTSSRLVQKSRLNDPVDQLLLRGRAWIWKAGVVRAAGITRFVVGQVSRLVRPKPLFDVEPWGQFNWTIEKIFENLFEILALENLIEKY